MTLGNDLDETFYKLGQRLTALENNQDMFSFKEDTKNLRHEVGDLNAEAATFATYAQLKKIETELTEQIVRIAAQDSLSVECEIERIETELNDRIDDECCDSRVENVEDEVSDLRDRIEDLDCYKMTEEEVEYLLDSRLDDMVSEAVTNAVCDEVNERAVGWTEFLAMRDRVKELEDRLNKPTLGARVLRWLREGPSVKQIATGWYAGMRRGS